MALSLTAVTALQHFAGRRVLFVMLNVVAPKNTPLWRVLLAFYGCN
jgi:hypothetical protein